MVEFEFDVAYCIVGCLFLFYLVFFGFVCFDWFGLLVV